MPPEGSGEALFAVTAPGLERLAAAELRSLGIEAEPEPGGVGWSGGVEELYAVNLHLRTASRVLVRVAEFQAKTFYELERKATKIAWGRFLTEGRPVRWRVTSRKSRLYHQGAVEQRFQEAVQRTVGAAAAGAAGEEEEGEGEQLFIVRFLHDRCTVSADASGALLHRRGYRRAVAKAPLRETLAAGMLLASGWDASSPLIDPLCGAGTIPIEAALLARAIPPGLASPDLEPRAYAFQRWPEFDAPIWERVLERARSSVRRAAGVIIQGSDRDAGAVQAAVANAARAGVAGEVELSARALSAVEPPEGPGWLVTNPPYGVRVGESGRVRDLYAALGRVARERLPGWTVALLSADRRLEGQVGIRFEEVVATRNGGIPVRVVVGRSGYSAP